MGVLRAQIIYNIKAIWYSNSACLLYVALVLWQLLRLFPVRGADIYNLSPALPCSATVSRLISVRCISHSQFMA
jgi:hypothetical protein